MERNKIIVAVVVIVLVLMGGVFFMNSRSSGKQETKTETDADVIPTVDGSVKVTLEKTPSGHDIELAVKGIPKGTEIIDYELSYETEEQGLQGLIGSMETKGDTSAKKSITLGTCSSGTCVYHNVKGSVRVALKFTGDYGERVFEKEFDL